MLDKIIEELVELIQGSTTEYGNGYNTAITEAIEIVRKYGTNNYNGCGNNSNSYKG